MLLAPSGCLLGLPKVHEVGTLPRPLVSSIDMFNYHLAKCLVQIIEPFTTNEYTADNTLDLVNGNRQLSFEDSTVVASFDAEPFTSVPSSETTQISTNSISDEFLSQFDLNKKQFNSFLNVVTSDSIFTFDNQWHAQINGVAMGSAFGPSYADLVLCKYECNSFNNCPDNFQPIFYKRCTDDMVLLFKQHSYNEQILSYLNE